MKELELQPTGIYANQDKVLTKQLLQTTNGIKSIHFGNSNSRIIIKFDPNIIDEQKIIKSLSKFKQNFSIIKNKEIEKNKFLKLDRPKLFLVISGILTCLAFLTLFLGYNKEITNVIFGLAILIGIVYPFKSSLIALKSFYFTDKLIMLVGVIGTIYLGLLDEGALLVFIYSLGDVLELYTTNKARNALKNLTNKMPKEGLVRRGNNEKLITVKDIQINDIVIIKPGEKIPVDGLIKLGQSFVNESSITGEAHLVEKKEGDIVYAGTINQNGVLEAITTKTANETTFAKIVQSVEELKAKKSSQERFVQKFDDYFTPAMFLLGILVALSPIVIGGSFYASIYKGLVLFVVSCSCGLALSVPIAIVSATINGSRNGILFKGGSYIELAQKLNVIAFDKTGTLTFGKPIITDILKIDDMSEQEFWGIIQSIESRSNHPIANSIMENIPISSLNSYQVTSLESVGGIGIKALVENEEYFLGNKRFYSNQKQLFGNFEEKITELENEGKTVVVLGKKNKILGILAVIDKIRPESEKCLEELKRMGIRTTILTGDNGENTKLIASKLKIPEYSAELLPEMKVERIKYLKAKYGSTGMVGDGINDTPAMAASDLGFAMGAVGSDTAIDSGDIVLMSDDLTKLTYALKLSKRTYNNIRENIYISLVTIIFLVSFTLVGWIGLVPGLLLNEASGILVCINALRLLK